MLLYFLVTLCASVTIVNGHCGPCGPMPKHYEELGCTGDYIEPSCCPDRYECPDLTKLDSSVCHLNGKTYQKGETVTKEDSTPCNEGCICTDSGIGESRFVCPVKDCPEALGPSDEDCVHKHSLDQCCAVDKVCGAESKNLPQCHFRGEAFNFGDKFYAPTVYAECHQCVCDENFDNSTVIEDVDGNKSCKKANCDLQLLYLDEFKIGCTPIYNKDTKCCPIGFRCPSETDKVAPSEGLPDISTVNPKLLCKFGALTLRRGEGIVTDENCLTCTCRQPPMIECIRSANCEY